MKNELSLDKMMSAIRQELNEWQHSGKQNNSNSPDNPIANHSLGMEKMSSIDKIMEKIRLEVYSGEKEMLGNSSVNEGNTSSRPRKSRSLPNEIRYNPGIEKIAFKITSRIMKYRSLYAIYTVIANVVKKFLKPIQKSV